MTDCQAVVSVHGWDRGRPTAHTHKHAACWLDYRPEQVKAVHKVKPHLSAGESAVRGEGHWHAGHGAVGGKARRAVPGKLNPGAVRCALLRAGLGEAAQGPSGCSHQSSHGELGSVGCPGQGESQQGDHNLRLGPCMPMSGQRGRGHGRAPTVAR